MLAQAGQHLRCLQQRASSALPADYGSQALALIICRRISSSRTYLFAKNDDEASDILGGRRERSIDRDMPADVSEADLKYEPMMYHFTPIPADDSASRLSNATKENIWYMHTTDPRRYTVEKLARDYKIRQQRVHAIILLKEIEKKWEKEQRNPLDSEIEREVEKNQGTVMKAAGERHWKMNFETSQVEDEDASHRRLREESDKEELYKVQDFVLRISFNKKQMDDVLKVDKLERRRPPEGWSYVVEELGSEGRRGFGGGKRVIAQPDGTHRALSELDKEFLRRETRKPRRRLVPR
eukprot:jgi/Mesen1/5023/ME000025S04426